MAEWLVRTLGSDASGPYTTDSIAEAVDNGDLGVELEVCRVGEERWLPIEMVPEFADLAFFDGHTHVVQSPWFAPAGSTGAMPATEEPAPRQHRPTPADEYRELVTEVIAPPSELLAQAAPSQRPPGAGTVPLPAVPASPRVVEAAAKRPAPPSVRSYDDLDQTMTRVASQRGQEPAPVLPRSGGVLPTLTMDRFELPIPPEAPPDPVAVPQGSVSPAQSPDASNPAAVPHGYPQDLGQYPHDSGPEESDLGVKALIALIALLALALVVVLALLAMQS